MITASGAEIPAGEVILSGGSYGSPAVLLRSGVGPAADLAQLGIDVLADLPVGQHLQDQPFYYNGYALKTDALDMRPAVGALLWRQSSEARGDELDIHIAVTHLLPAEYSPTGGAITLGVALVKPESRGTVRRRSRDPREQPEIDCNFLAEDRDARRILEGVKLARKIGPAPACTWISASAVRAPPSTARSTPTTVLSRVACLTAARLPPAPPPAAVSPAVVAAARRRC